jgi:hypothetical protein
VRQTSYILIDYKYQTVEGRLSMRVFKEDDYWFAECPELRLLDQGRTKRKSIEHLILMSQASITEAILSDNINVMLKELGFKRGKMILENRELYKQQIEKFNEYLPLNVDVPIPNAWRCSVTS